MENKEVRISARNWLTTYSHQVHIDIFHFNNASLVCMFQGTRSKFFVTLRRNGAGVNVSLQSDVVSNCILYQAFKYFRKVFMVIHFFASQALFTDYNCKSNYIFDLNSSKSYYEEKAYSCMLRTVEYSFCILVTKISDVF